MLKGIGTAYGDEGAIAQVSIAIRGVSAEEAVRMGISAGTVTSAAVVMVAVLATLSFVEMKEMGIGLAAAVLIDATIIRGVLLPASMKLLGDRTWYMPRLLTASAVAAGDRPGRSPPRLEPGARHPDGARGCGVRSLPWGEEGDRWRPRGTSSA